MLVINCVPSGQDGFLSIFISTSIGNTNYRTFWLLSANNGGQPERLYVVCIGRTVTSITTNCDCWRQSRDATILPFTQMAQSTSLAFSYLDRHNCHLSAERVNLGGTEQHAEILISMNQASGTVIIHWFNSNLLTVNSSHRTSKCPSIWIY